MRSLIRIALPALALAFVALGCGSPEDDEQLTPRPEGAGKDRATKADHWNWNNDPERFQVELNYVLAELPKEGRSEHVPWPDTYWPTYQDSINARWQCDGWGSSCDENMVADKMSPAEKYDMAFNGWTPDEAFLKLVPFDSSSSGNCADKSWSKEYYEKLGPAAKYVSNNKGNKEARDGKDSDGDGATDECDDHDGVETWWGLCHAWVPAAILEPEPQRQVEHNGVKFEVGDIKALLQDRYDRSKAYMIGGRCNDKEVKRDEKTGRIMDEQCRDTNAGSWHVVMANFLGLMKRSIAEDRTFDYQVWNQPIIEWKVTQLDEISESKACELLKVEGGKYPYNANAKKWFEVKATSYYITESDASTVPYTDTISSYTRTDNYHYILEVNAGGKIDGGEWLGASITNHPDFLWLPVGAGGGNPHIDTSRVRMLLEKSRTPEQPNVEEPDSDLLTFENPNEFPIPDNDPNGVSSTIDVHDAITVGKLEVDVSIEHTYVGDLKVVLRKDGKESVLHDQAGGSAHNLTRTFTVTNMAGLPAAGTWELRVSDHSGQDTGKVKSWKLKIAVAGGDTPTDGGTVKGSATPGASIPDNDASGVTSKIEIADRKTIKGMKVAIDIEHSYIGALTVELKHGAVKHTLHNQEGGSGTSISKTFDVTAFNGGLTEGSWELHVVDNDAYNDAGKLMSWSVEMTY